MKKIFATVFILMLAVSLPAWADQSADDVLAKTVYDLGRESGITSVKVTSPKMTIEITKDLEAEMEKDPELARRLVHLWTVVLSRHVGSDVQVDVMNGGKRIMGSRTIGNNLEIDTGSGEKK